MNVPRRRRLPIVLVHAAATGALITVSCDNSVASSSAQNKQENSLVEQESDTASSLNGDAMRGEQIYNIKCGACHSIDQNRIGPKHRGVFGRRVGGLDDYAYSEALTNVDLVWDDATLDQWLRAPTKMFPGTRMGFAVSDNQERADIIAYLKSNSE